MADQSGSPSFVPAVQKSYAEVDQILQKYLREKGYNVLLRTSVESHGTFTYQVEKDEMPYWVKIGYTENFERCAEVGRKRKELDATQGRVEDLKNEVAALTALWLKYPSGETDSFQFPPGPEEVFEEEYAGLNVYGYARFVVEGKILGQALRDGSAKFSEWIECCSKMVKTIDSLPDLHLSRTELNRDVKFEELIVNNASFGYDRMKLMLEKGNQGVSAELVKQAGVLVQEARDYFSLHRVVTGTVHGDFQPEHIVYLEEGGLPTLVQFSKICQWYPRHWDIAKMYGWVAVVAGDLDGARMFWKHMLEKTGLSKERIDYLKVITNIVTLGMMSTAIEPGWDGGKLKVGVEAFVN